jgi:hypothetical protein
VWGCAIRFTVDRAERDWGAINRILENAVKRGDTEVGDTVFAPNGSERTIGAQAIDAVAGILNQTFAPQDDIELEPVHII